MTPASTSSPDSYGPGSLKALWDEQRARWRRGERPTLEEFIDRLPSVPPLEDIMDIVYGEYVLRQECGETPTTQEYTDRFPQLAESIRRQFAIDAFLTEHAITVETLRTSRTPADPALAVPEFIGRYRIIGALDGGRGRVYRALHPTLGRDVVLKIGAGLAGDREGLQEEGRILAALDHPHLAKVYDLDFHEGRPFLVMEFIAGRNLEQHARLKPPTPRQAAALVAAVARALAAAHRRGVIHRDIKPQNIVVDDSGRPRLIDFGLAMQTDAWHEAPLEPGTLVGTLAYMAPEQARAATEQVGPRTDVFALGGVLYFLLTGKPPFDGSSFPDVLLRAANNDWDRAALARVPRALRNVCLRAMAADPAARYATADDLAADLEAYRRRPLLLALSVAVAATFVLALALALGFGQRSPLTNSPAPITDADSTQGPTLTVRVWSVDRYRDIEHCLPLQTGEEVQVRAEVPAGSYAALFVFGSDGRLRRLASVAAEDAKRTLRYPPEEDRAAPLEKPAGTELLFVVARRSGPVGENDVRELWGTETEWPALPGGSLLAMRRDKIEVVVGSRTIGEPTVRSDPEGDVRLRLEKLRSRLRERFEHVEGLAFAHR